MPRQGLLILPSSIFLSMFHMMGKPLLYLFLKKKEIHEKLMTWTEIIGGE